jgi:hypothetical protein
VQNFWNDPRIIILDSTLEFIRVFLTFETIVENVKEIFNFANRRTEGLST